MQVITTGVVFRPQLPPEQLRNVVEATEAAGVAELWVWEDCFLEGGLTTATAALAWSKQLRIGIGLLPVALRNPALAAMEIATLARLFPGRFLGDDELAELVRRSVRDLGGAGATSVVFVGSPDAPDPGPLLQALAASVGPSR